LQRLSSLCIGTVRLVGSTAPFHILAHQLELHGLRLMLQIKAPAILLIAGPAFVGLGEFAGFAFLRLREKQLSERDFRLRLRACVSGPLAAIAGRWRRLRGKCRQFAEIPRAHVGGSKRLDDWLGEHLDVLR
jgi:hypothetical protein